MYLLTCVHVEERRQTRYYSTLLTCHFVAMIVRYILHGIQIHPEYKDLGLGINSAIIPLTLIHWPRNTTSIPLDLHGRLPNLAYKHFKEQEYQSGIQGGFPQILFSQLSYNSYSDPCTQSSWALFFSQIKRNFLSFYIPSKRL